ncbi:MAG: 2-succinylbenzoate--CoA ligase [Cyanosarcina radialis HA8281-LM2]|jgi:O-succinylbenzoic acid--CoA ligase|nr:2-succinylbenzoate--CoA ligase [Cyanosarcina radialis HA8281-LM2]
MNLVGEVQRRSKEDWLVGIDGDEFVRLTEELLGQLERSIRSGNLPNILLAESDSLRFLSGFVAACAAGCPVFLCNPNWGESEWQQVFNLVNPDLIWGKPLNYSPPLPLSPSPSLPLSRLIMIPTGGTSGQVRFAMHTWETLTASVRGFCQYFGVDRVNSFCVLPLYHVSGLMQFMRAFVTGGSLVIKSFKNLDLEREQEIELEKFFISLVPTQLQHLLFDRSTWLSRFHTVLLGGAPAWNELLSAARVNKIRLSPTYGMTETASQIVTLKPEDFLNGNDGCGRVLPHAKVEIIGENDEILGSDRPGIISIQSDSLALGYYPDKFQEQNYFITDDLGYFDDRGYLNLVGRNSDKIITGGENVFPLEVESAIKNTQLVSDVCVIGLPDNYWGQAVTAVYVPSDSFVSEEGLKNAIATKLSKFKQPKYWIPVDALPRSDRGKLDRKQMLKIALRSRAFREY